MSEALERVIAEQQKEIDRLKASSMRDVEQLKLQYKHEKELYQLLDGVVDLRFKCATEDYQKVWADYRQKIRLYMHEHGWCFNCGCFSCECDE